ncbi:MAG: TetR family transcriptional regulator [Alphaproteobacteria bacterium]|nr:TetR family transcriptional regulator [Alphaproteobacteria bacterium]
MATSNETLIDNNARGAKRRLESRKRLLTAARKLFVERGYHATRPQDITRAAGLGHGTFYLHFADKRDCFLAFVDEAREEVDAAIMRRSSSAKDLPGFIEAILTAIYDYSEEHPGLLATALTDEAVIASGDGKGEMTLLHRWGEEWAEMLKVHAKTVPMARDYDLPILGQAVVGAIQQASSFAFRTGRSRAHLVKTLTQLIVRALSPRS